MMRKKHTIAYLIGCQWLLLSACDIINPPEAIPAYIYVPGFEVNIPSSQGSASTRITEVWLSVNGNFLGAYSLPALIPILEEGSQNITLEAGIKENGVNATPDIYPFYRPWEMRVNLRSNEVDTLRPVVGYRNEARFAFIEPFENANHIFQELRAGTNFNRIQIVRENAFEGNSALIELNEDNPLVEIGTSRRFSDLTTRGFVVYMEMNYRSDVDVIFGVQGYKNGLPGTAFFDPGFTARGDWNKIYFNMSPLFFGGDFDEFQILIQTLLPANNGVFTKTKASIWLDNIKLVHF